MMRGIHHIGILVRDARAAAERFRLLGLEVASWEDYGPGLLRIGFIPLGDVLIELLQPLTADGFNADWLRERGEGLQHLAFAVDDLRHVLNVLAARAVPLTDSEPRPGAAGAQIAFLARDGTGGTMLELTQPVPPHDSPAGDTPAAPVPA
jgi:methylmalonyl-CoA/ethylmalonyl-CoA epimerase